MATIELYLENSKNVRQISFQYKTGLLCSIKPFFIQAAVGSLVTGESLNKVMKPIIY
ncbi:hypothetical protein RCO48_21690 [Peribacillus frigoritolerans]|nr:hypothetical protein [Peribacillus frigoritolerans]